MMEPGESAGLAKQAAIDLRIECWSRKGKRNGKINRYWQWCERHTSGGRRRRFYGGTWDSLSPERREAAWNNITRRFADER